MEMSFSSFSRRDVSSVSPRVDLVQKQEWRQVGWPWIEATTVTYVIPFTNLESEHVS